MNIIQVRLPWILDGIQTRETYRPQLSDSVRIGGGTAKHGRRYG